MNSQLVIEVTSQDIVNSRLRAILQVMQAILAQQVELEARQGKQSIAALVLPFLPMAGSSLMESKQMLLYLRLLRKMLDIVLQTDSSDEEFTTQLLDIMKEVVA